MRKLFLLTASLLFVAAFTISCDNSQKCGKTPFDPEKQFCFAGGAVHDKCGGKVYDPTKKFCQAGESYSKCGGKVYDPAEKFCVSDEIHDKCAGKGYDPSTKFCFNNKELREKCGEGGYDPEKQFCFNDEAYDKCNDNEYDPEKQLCDSRDSKTYKVTKIGEQIWMAENLNYEAKNSLCYDNKPANCAKYGRLYDLNASAKACPKGWHLPNGKDWDALIGKDAAIGKKLKSGFSALPGGYRQNNKFRDAGKEGRWWEASKKGDVRSLKFSSNKVSRDPSGKASNYSIRCVKN